MPAAPIGVEQGARYVITGPDGSRAVINDPTDVDFVGYLSEPPAGLERANVRESADTLPEADGGVHGAFRYDRLSFTLPGIIDVYTDPTLSALRQAKLLRATDAMLADALLEWTPSTAPPVRVAFRQQQPTRITGARPKTFLVAGVAEDPLIYSQQAISMQVLAGSAAGAAGFSSPLRSPLSSGQGATGQALAENVGNRPTWPVFTFAGPITNPGVRSVTLGLDLLFNYTLAAGETLVVDTNPRRRTIRLNGTGNRYSALNYALSTWFPLVPGINDLRLTAAAFTAGANLVIDYRHAWG